MSCEGASLDMLWLDMVDGVEGREIQKEKSMARMRTRDNVIREDGRR
jgi:hypothetical protein